MLKAFALVGYRNESVLHAIFEQLSLVVSTLSNQVRLAAAVKPRMLFRSCGQLPHSRLTPRSFLVDDLKGSELMARLCSDLDRRSLSDFERENYTNMQSSIRK